MVWQVVTGAVNAPTGGAQAPPGGVAMQFPASAVSHAPSRTLAHAQPISWKQSPVESRRLAWCGSALLIGVALAGFR